VGEQRAKEISIRKVMGASIAQMMGLLFKDFTILIVVAFVIAAPLGWYLTNNWLQGFAYRVNIDAGLIFVSGLASLVVAMLTISYQSIKAARANPVVSLKSE
jgi:putative ABC transport system permease protein